jgi:hypothetical protein
MKPPKQLLYGLLAMVALALLIPLTAWAAPAPQATSACAETYTVQADDWLSKIADKFLGDTRPTRPLPPPPTKPTPVMLPLRKFPTRTSLQVARRFVFPAPKKLRRYYPPRVPSRWNRPI